MTRPFGILVAIVGGLALILTYLALQGAAPDAARHERTLEALRTLTLSDAALQRDVLRARAGLLGSYDPLVDSVTNLRRAAAALQNASAAAAGETRAELGRRAEGVAAAVREQEMRVDSFKSRNATLQNSLAYFSHLSNQLGATGGRQGDGPVAGVSALANAMLRFTAGQRRDSTPDVTAALARLARSDAPDGLGRSTGTLVAHGRLIVGTLPAVDDLVASILAAPISERTRAMQDSYLDFYGRMAARADLFRALLYVIALLLAVYLAYLFVRLRANTQVLRSRLTFESLIAAVSTAFIDLPIEQIGTSIEDGLSRLGEHTGTDRASVIIAEKGRVARFHAWRRSPAGPPDLPPQTLLAVAMAWNQPDDEGQGWIHVADVAALPDGAEKSRLQQGGIRTWLCIPMWRAGERTGFLSFGSLRRKRWLDDDIALLRTAAEIFANAIDRERSEADREALQARLAQAQRLEAVGTLAGGVAHEFNNVLGVILGSAEMALISPAAPVPIRHRLRQIMMAGERAQNVVDQILAFSRRRERQYRSLRVQPVIAEAIELIRTSLPSTITLSARLDAEDVAVRGDPTELQQVVMNLCTNAAHAMDGRGTIDLALDTVAVPRDRVVSHGSLVAGPYVRLAVRDTGRGMDADTMARIVEPFFTTKPVGRGTGLGLPSVHGIVTQHGGALNVESRPGQGSTFEAYWPQTEMPADDDAAESAASVPQGGGEAVLLVDDEAALVLLGEDMLAALGYEPVGFDASRAALSAFQAEPQRFDLALLDEIMPDMTGSELASALHEVRPDMPIVLMTGYPGTAAAQRLGTAGIREVLGKPLRSASLAECLARHLKAPGGSAEATRR